MIAALILALAGVVIAVLALAAKREQLVLSERIRQVGDGIQVGVEVGRSAPHSLGRQTGVILMMEAVCDPCWLLAARLRSAPRRVPLTAVITGDVALAEQLGEGVAERLITGTSATSLSLEFGVTATPVAVRVRNGIVEAVDLPSDSLDIWLLAGDIA